MKSDFEKQRLSASYQSITEDFVGKNDKAGLIGCFCEPELPLYFANQKMAALLGYGSVEELTDAIDGKVVNTIHPEDLPLVMEKIAETNAPDKTYEIIYRMARKDGSWFWTVDRGKRIETESGKSAIISLCSDMTGFMKWHETLLAQNEQLHHRESFSAAILENMPGGYHRCSTEDGFPFTYISDRFAQILGWTKEEIKTLFDNKYANLIHPEDRQPFEMYERMAHGAGHGNLYDERVYRMKSKGGYKWIQNTTMLVDLGGDSFFHGTIADITEFVEAAEQQQKELAEAMQKAEAASRAKSAFLFNMSHDIRTPMNAVIGFTELADKHLDDPVLVHGYIEKIRNAGNVLLRLINDILDFARIESDSLALRPAPVDLRQSLNNVVDLFTESMKSAGLEFTVQTELTDTSVLCDEVRLHQILINLLNNAQKFTKSGGKVLFCVEQTGAVSDGCAEYRFTVRDTGIGMDEQFLSRVFNSFERSSAARAAGIPGTGLGLSIVKKLVDKMGGSIELKSHPNVGTQATVCIRFQLCPQKQSRQNTAARDEQVNFTGKRLLLVEDNALNREIACEMLREMGFNLDTAEDGVAALRKVENAAAGEYDLILMDIQMPHMDGYAATRAIRALKDSALASIPIVAMTANAFEEDKQKCFAAGMNGHITKPISFQTVRSALAEVLRTH